MHQKGGAKVHNVQRLQQINKVCHHQKGGDCEASAQVMILMITKCEPMQKSPQITYNSKLASF
ncbi:MAG: hypothetical protein Q8736_02650 [Sweet potato little leaf phytoplasma]|nr:hypothetical protein [Sweet potato little leaf phytoplasma]